MSSFIEKDLEKKMVFLTGPRQCGKTTLAEDLLKKRGKGIYLNWDDPDHKKFILKRDWSDHHDLVILDEIHKFKKWKSWIKGTYDTQKKNHSFLVTGSARLDVFRKGGDSLLGRYHLWHLHPFTLSEIPKGISPKEAFKRLMFMGGFPEPFLDNSDREARRWRRERMEKVLKEDVRELEDVKDIQTLQLLVELLRTRVGSPVVVSNLAEDLQVSPVTVKRWIEILEAMYIIFRVKPFSQNISRAIQKPPKIYFYDNGDVEDDEGARFENLVATHLLKAIQFSQDADGHSFDLRYLRDKEKREVDFVILKNNKPLELIEAKFTDTKISSHLTYYAERLSIPKATQIVSLPNYTFSRGHLKVVDVFSELSDVKKFSRD